MRHAIAGALLIAAISTLGDFVWAGLHLRHRVAYGLAHGTLSGDNNDRFYTPKPGFAGELSMLNG